MHRGKIRGLRRFLELKSIRETPPTSLWKRVENPADEGSFLRKVPLTGAESYQISGALHMVRRCGDPRSDKERELLRWIVLYILHQSGNGHIRISRQDLLEDFPLWRAGATGKQDREERLDSLDELMEGNPRLFARLPDSRGPIVGSEDGEALYLLKRWRYEKRFLGLLSPLLGQSGCRIFPEGEDPGSLIGQIYRELREDASLLLGEETLQAAQIVSSRRFSIITGGPGTGKTTILGGLLRLVLEAERRRGRGDLTVRLCAPTGRAAGRMEESLRDLLRDPRYSTAFPGEPSTLHKLLGLVPGSPPRFNGNRPLTADLLVVDEASMVDLNLMYYLLDALKPGAGLLLVGDKDQLPSVEAGALLSDFLYGREEPGYRLRGGVLSLSRVHRNSGAILDGAALVIRGDREGFRTFLNNPERSPARKERPPGSDGLFYYGAIPEYRIFLETMLEEFGLRSLRDAVPAFDRPVNRWEECRSGIDRYFQLYRDRTILVPSRRGLFGVDSLNRGLRAQLAPGEGPVFHGQPVMITRNDYERDLFNGDRGVILSFQGEFYGFFEDPRTGGYRYFPASLLGEYQTAFALTIHKSQGSEYGAVTVVISEGVERLLSREILYTGITRAKHQVTLLSRQDLVDQCLARGVRRQSGIREFMTRPEEG